MKHMEPTQVNRDNSTSSQQPSSSSVHSSPLNTSTSTYSNLHLTSGMSTVPSFPYVSPFTLPNFPFNGFPSIPTSLPTEISPESLNSLNVWQTFGFPCETDKGFGVSEYFKTLTAAMMKAYNFFPQQNETNCFKREEKLSSADGEKNRESKSPTTSFQVESDSSTTNSTKTSDPNEKSSLHTFSPSEISRHFLDQGLLFGAGFPFSCFLSQSNVLSPFTVPYTHQGIPVSSSNLSSFTDENRSNTSADSTRTLKDTAGDSDLEKQKRTPENSSFRSNKKVKSVKAIADELRQNQVAQSKSTCSNQESKKLRTNVRNDQYTIRDLLQRRDQQQTFSEECQTAGNILHSLFSHAPHGLINRQDSCSTDRDSGENSCYDEGFENVVRRRRKPEEPDENLIRIPLTMGWERKTHIRVITRNGVRGDVIYFAPDGRKLKSFQEIDRENQCASEILLTNEELNFEKKCGGHGICEYSKIKTSELSSKILVGKFVQHKYDDNMNPTSEELSEEEMIALILKLNPDFRRVESNDGPNKRKACSFYKDTNAKQIKENVADFVLEKASDEQTVAKGHERELNDTRSGSLEHGAENPTFTRCFQRHPSTNSQVSESSRKQDDRTALQVQKQQGKSTMKDQKLRQRHMEVIMAKELKNVTEDLQIRETLPLPKLPRFTDVKVSNKVFVNVLVVAEFLSNFGRPLGIAESSIPSLNALQNCILGTDPDHISIFNSLCQTLLRLALNDPGLPTCRKSTTVMGNKISCMDVNDYTLSEILRIFIRERNGYDDELTQTLSEKSLYSLSPELKVNALTFLCDELLCSRRIVEGIDSNLSSLMTLRHSKWELEGKLRRLKLQYSKVEQTKSFDDSSLCDLTKDEQKTKLCNGVKVEDVSASDDDSERETVHTDDDDNLESLSLEEIDQRIEKTQNDYEIIKQKVLQKSTKLRCVNLGLDRYHRRYWMFPRLSSILVEGSSTDSEIAEDEHSNFNESVNISFKEEEMEVDRSNENLSENMMLLEIPPSNVRQSVFESLIKRYQRNEEETNEKEMDNGDDSPLDLSFPGRSRKLYDRMFPLYDKPICPCGNASYFLMHLPNCMEQADLINGATSAMLKELEALVKDKMEFPYPQPVPKEYQKGWWKIDDISLVHTLLDCLCKRGIREKSLARSITKHMEQIEMMLSKTSSLVDDTDSAIASTESCSFPSDNDNKESVVECDSGVGENFASFEPNILNEVYTLEDRVFAASLQIKGSSYATRKPLSKMEDQLANAKVRLANLELMTERRYLKPPFVRKTDYLNLLNVSNNINCKDDEATPALERWRRSVREAKTSSQLALCLTQFDRNIAWEKSVMRVICQICNRDENEDRLLLCDSCDKGHHTYCFKPQLTDVPEGDWFCFTCLSAAQNTPLCFVCGTSSNNLISCEKCSKLFHLQCHKGTRVNRSRFQCNFCYTNCRKKNKRVNCSKTSPSGSNNVAQSNSDRESIPMKKRRNNQTPDFVQRCKIIVNELLAHEASWPFREPVDSEVYPEYYDIIKKPMDFQTIKKKHKLNQYTSKEELAADIRQIFENCHFYNEDNSLIGQAGIEMKEFFEKRWKEIFG